MRKTLTTALVAFAVTSPLQAKTALPRIAEPAARTTALALVPHSVVKANELETEHGRLIYSYDVAQPGRSGIEEVQISAMTGRLVSRHHESPAKERAEAVADAAAAVVK